MKYEIYIRQKGKPEPYYVKAMEEYMKRLGGDCKVGYQLIRKEKEWVKLQSEAKKPGQILIFIGAGEARVSSEQLAARIGDWEMSGVKSVIFLIEDPLRDGRSTGNSEGKADLNHKADLNYDKEADLLHLSSFTMPPAMSAMILLEQIYRGYRIRSNQPYHK